MVEMANINIWVLCIAPSKFPLFDKLENRYIDSIPF